MPVADSLRTLKEDVDDVLPVVITEGAVWRNVNINVVEVVIGGKFVVVELEGFDFIGHLLFLNPDEVFQNCRARLDFFHCYGVIRTLSREDTFVGEAPDELVFLSLTELGKVIKDRVDDIVRNLDG